MLARSKGRQNELPRTTKSATQAMTGRKATNTNYSLLAQAGGLP